jgi:hypothetical protein
MKVFKQCPAALSSFEELGFLTTTGDRIFTLLANGTAEINPIRKSQPSSDLTLNELSNLPSMIIPSNLQ